MSQLSLYNPITSVFTDPLDPFSVTQRGFNPLFALAEIPALAAGSFAPATFVPSVNVVESDGEIKVSAELPGLTEKEVSLNLTADSLRLSGEKRVELKEKKPGYRHVECSYGKFTREVPLPVEVDLDKVDAKMHNGVLTVTLKKSPHARSIARKVAVKCV